MPIGLTEAAAISGIVSGTLAVGAAAKEWWDSETGFERLRDDFARAARERERVYKRPPETYFFKHKEDSTRQVSFQPLDGWLENQWRVKTWKYKDGQWHAKERMMKTSECVGFFDDRYLKGKYGMNRRQRDSIAEDALA